MNRRTFCQSMAGATLAGSSLMAKAGVLGIMPAEAAEGTEEQREALALMLKVLTPTRRAFRHGRISAYDLTWEEWQKRTGELPPKFSEMPSRPFLPDPLEGVHNKADWEKHRGEIRALAEHWMTGRVPPAPDNLRSTVIKETKEGNLTIRDVRLDFGPNHRAYLNLQLLIPAGDGPLPVFLTNQGRTGPWAPVAVARGYIGVIFMAADEQDDSDKYIEVYPDYDFSCLTRRAWAASRAVDYLYTLPEVDRKCIAVSGHSRNGKMALIAAAYDGHIDSRINDQYRSPAGARRFLHNIVQYPGCGTFYRPASYAAFDALSGRMCGVSLASIVAPDTGHITQICVTPSARGTGTGHELLRNSLTTLREMGCTSASLTVTAANEDAVRLYERVGFTTVRQFTAYVWERF